MDERIAVPVKCGDRVLLRRGNIAKVNHEVCKAQDGVPIYMLGNVMGAIRADGQAPGFAGFDAVEIIEKDKT
jgi:hypothetical protein